MIDDIFFPYSPPAVEDGCELPLDDVIIYLRKLNSIDDRAIARTSWEVFVVLAGCLVKISKEEISLESGEFTCWHNISVYQGDLEGGRYRPYHKIEDSVFSSLWD